MDGAQQHAFWKQRVYKEERDRYLLVARTSGEYPPSPTKRSPSPFGRSGTHSPYENDPYHLPPLKRSESPATRSPKNTQIPIRSSTPTSNQLYQKDRSTSPTHVSYRPRGPPASLHGVNGGYQTFTYQGRAFLEDSST
eukprot:TRINITY_DN334_c0_g1_i1.p1 TRINITY_DN334_c0_g1~~TRINITY_DN334_c0_g1_i1.p1  ORF type:complete len:138 (+),score=21.92 TRINITY_DN334_c0_g1_i1:86-499(+)